MLRSTFPFACICILLSHSAFSQHEGDNWVFGRNAGMRFMPDSTLSFFSSSIHTREGVASISDRMSGDLLFYTDGLFVWDRSHTLMPNGYGLWGNYSAAQSSVIIPKPGSATRYYIFTAPQLNQTDVPYTFSEVDMTLNNGLGDVVAATKNTPIGDDATEKLTVARHCNNRDFWVIMRHANGNRFSVRLVDPSGVQAPQTFNLGGYVDNSSWNKANYLKLSQDQHLLAHPIGPQSLDNYHSTLEMVAIQELPVITTTITASGCAGHPTGAIDILQLAPGAKIRLDGGDWKSGSSFFGLPAGVYQLGVQDVFGCVRETNAVVPEPPPYLLTIIADTSRADCGVIPLFVTHTSMYPVTYSWTPAKGLDCSDCANVTSTPKTDMVYTVDAIDTAGCTATASIRVPYRQLFHIYAPNVFSPNDDGVNDRFTLYGSLCVQTIRSLSIYDRWGGQLFYGTDLTPGNEQQGWDGVWRHAALLPGVYAWVAKVELYNGGVVQLSGSVTVVR